MSSSMRNGFSRTVRQAAKAKIGIRGEDPQRIWERRAPLTPDAVYKLTSSGRATVEVVSSSRRVFNDMEYRKAGASVVPTLTDPDIILGIKEPPISELHRLGASRKAGSQTHMMFSHTVKGQPYNTPLLACFVPSSQTPPPSFGSAHPRLVDYELLTGEGDGKRTVGFGWFAGVAGVLESLSSMAHSHLELGVASPFLYTPRPHTLPSLTKLREALRQIGSVVATQGTPSELGPFIFGLTGRGQVAQGCLSMLSELPIEMVKVADLDSLISRWRSADVDLRKIYLVHAQPEDYLVRLDGGRYEREHYYQSPQSYHSVFCDKVAPYLTLFLNGTGWSPSYPRLMNNDQLAIALTRAQPFGGARFTNIGDISCDVEGGLEFLTKATTLSSPFYKVRPQSLPSDLPSVQMMSVDILPASIPLDASVHFSSALEPYIGDLVQYHNYLLAGTPQTHFPRALERATIAAGGRLRERHQWLQSSVDQHYKKLEEKAETAEQIRQLLQPSVDQPSQKNEADMMAGLREVIIGEPTSPSPSASPSPSSSSESFASLDDVLSMEAEATTNGGGVVERRPPQLWGRKRRILMLGSGMVAGPAVDMIARNPFMELVIASDSSVELQRLVGPHLNVKFRLIDAGDPATYVSLIEEADVVISLLPAAMHVDIAKQCIKFKKDLVTASYISPEMEALNRAAIANGVILLNEVGLDPGIDHCSAMDLIGKLKSRKKTIVSFTSFCGGLPVPEDSRVPLGYKFSWRPQGVLTAALNEAQYLLNKEVVKIPGDQLLQSYFPDVPITEEFKLEGLPNRNSLDYIKRYNPGNYTKTFVRGTLRYPGFSSLMNSFSSLGLLNNSDQIHLGNWETFVSQALAYTPKAREEGASLSSIIPRDDADALRDALEWLGLARSEMLQPTNSRAMPPIPKGKHTPLDLFAYLLSQKLKYGPNERDMVVLSHEIITSGKVPGYERYKIEVHTSTLITTGTTTHDVGYKGERPASAMARTVGIPVAIAAMRVAEGKLGWRKGVVRPVFPDVYRPILEGLDEVGLRMMEKSVLGGKSVELALRVKDRSGDGEEHYHVPVVHDLDGDRNWKEEGVVV